MGSCKELNQHGPIAKKCEERELQVGKAVC